MILEIGGLDRPVDRVRSRHVGRLPGHPADVAGLVVGVVVIVDDPLVDDRRIVRVGVDLADLVAGEPIVAQGFPAVVVRVFGDEAGLVVELVEPVAALVVLIFDVEDRLRGVVAIGRAPLFAGQPAPRVVLVNNRSQSVFPLLRSQTDPDSIVRIAPCDQIHAVDPEVDRQLTCWVDLLDPPHDSPEGPAPYP